MACLVEPCVVFDGGGGARLCDAVQRIGVETVLDALQRIDQWPLANGIADPQARQRARLGQGVDDQQIVVFPGEGNLTLSPPKSI